MGMQERYRVTCDTPGCKSAGPWRADDDEAQKAAEKEMWTWVEDPAHPEGARDVCPKCRFGGL